MLNTALLKNPLNWGIVIMMIFIASMFGTFICSYISNSHSNQEV